MGEAADGLGGAVGGGFQGFQKLRAGDLHDVQGVAEGQHGVDVLLGDVPGGDGGADAAAVGDRCVHRLTQGVGLPQHGVGDQVAQVGLAGAHVGLFALQVHFGPGKDRAVVRVDLCLDGLGLGGHGCVGGDNAILDQGAGAHVGSLDGAVGGDFNDTDVFQLGAGGGEQGVVHGGVFVGGGHDVLPGGVGVTVDEHVDAVHVLQQVDGAVAHGLGINAQVTQTYDDVAALGGQSVHLGLGAVEHLLAGQEGNTLDLGGVGLGGGFGGVQTEEADLGAVGCGEDDVVAEGKLAVVLDVGSQDGEVGLGGQIHQVGEAIVKLVVAGGGHVVTGQVHELHSRCALGDAHGGVTLDKVAGVCQQHIRACVLVGLLQGGHRCVAADAAVDIVGVQDDDGTCHVLVFGLNSAGGNGQGEGHHHSQEESRELVPLLHS